MLETEQRIDDFLAELKRQIMDSIQFKEGYGAIVEAKQINDYFYIEDRHTTDNRPGMILPDAATMSITIKFKNKF